MAARMQGEAKVMRYPALDAKAERLKLRAGPFARLTLAERLSLIESVRRDYAAVLDEAVLAACKAKGLSSDGSLEHGAGEEWFAHGYPVMRHLRLLAESLRGLLKNGRLPPSSFRNRPSGALAVRVHPGGWLDRLSFPGIQAELYFQAGLDSPTIEANRAGLYRDGALPEQGVSLILGAGNVASIPPRDLLQKVFHEGKVALLKLNPVNDYLGPWYERAFASLIDKGFAAITYGGRDEGEYLRRHPCIDELHLTGSAETYDRIVWGDPEERAERKRDRVPLCGKPITAELGNISPIIVLPGPWTEAELDYQARNIAGMLVNNASFNCNAAKLLITPRRWRGREALLERLGKILDATPRRPAYYPGAFERFRALTEHRSKKALHGPPAPESSLPWALLTELDASDIAEPLFRLEPWCSVLGETPLEDDDARSFLDSAVDFVNTRVWGNLCVTLLAHPASLREAGMAHALDDAIERLRYGTVAVNLWPAVAFALGSTAWGGHPTNRPEDIQSGVGWTGNTSLYEGIEKTVVRAPFVMKPKPPWFPDHRALRKMGRAAVDLERTGSWLTLPPLAWAALRG